ncbi:MAG: FtsW/RodA/SpoVE family cell cycle protein, partial [Anaerolineaceae bacterium]|nr:FtsW/RodA/SpoVE family cell cycle protein [Anaerolineaceae bacterium]
MSNRDPYLLPIVGLLMGIGLLTIFRLNVNFGLRQSLWIILSTIILFVSFQKSEWLKRFRNYKYLWLLFGLALTALTFFLGIYPSGNGPQLWLSFGGIFIQPSEPLKILLIIYLSAYLSDRWSSRKNFPALIIPTIIVILLALLLLVGQRDLGTASIFIFIFAFYMFLVSGKRRILILFALILFIAGYIGYQMFGVIKIRVDSWLNPWLDPGGNSYQVLQSIQAMAAGKLLGSGPGVGSPGLIPVALSDFIFAAITEELGLFGALS